jgi:hypothetical protein
LVFDYINSEGAIHMSQVIINHSPDHKVTRGEWLELVDDKFPPRWILRPFNGIRYYQEQGLGSVESPLTTLLRSIGIE